jgi:hypothetical protein
MLRTKANDRFASGVLLGFAVVSSLRIVGVRVKAIRRRTAAITLGVNRRWRWPKKPVRPTKASIAPPSAIAELTGPGPNP